MVLFIGLTVAGLFKIRKQKFNGYRTPFFPLTPLAFLALTAIVLSLIALRNPLQTALGATVVLAGLPVYYLVFSRREKLNDGLD